MSMNISKQPDEQERYETLRGVPSSHLSRLIQSYAQIGAKVALLEDQEDGTFDLTVAYTPKKMRSAVLRTL